MSPKTGSRWPNLKKEIEIEDLMNVITCWQGRQSFFFFALSSPLNLGTQSYTPNSVISTPHNIPHSLVSRKPRERMFVVQISLLVVIFLSLISQVLSLVQATKEVNSHPRIALCVNMWSVFFFFFFVLSGVDHTNEDERKMNSKFHSVTCYTNSIVSRIHVNTKKPRNIMCTLVATCVIQQSFRVYLRPSAC